MTRIAVVLLIVFGFATSVAQAHPALFTSAHIYIQPDGKFQLFTSFDLLAFALNKTSSEVSDPAMNALLDGPQDELDRKIKAARANFLGSLKLQTDQGAATITDLKFTTLDEVNQWKHSGRKPRLPVVAMIKVEGTLPVTASQVQVSFPVSLGTVVLTLNRPDDTVYDEPISAGYASSKIPIRLEKSDTSDGQKLEVPSAFQIWLRYIAMGITHIIPEGTDHICFILGLFLASTELRSLLWQVTAFTLAHSFTLALSLYGVFQLPAYIVEPGIALTIIFVGVENLGKTSVGYRRIFLVFAFGLIHGLGFAGAIQATGLPRADFLTALIGFNIGVELGQLIVITVAFLLIGWYRQSPNYRARVIVPASLLISIIAACWFVLRIADYFSSGPSAAYLEGNPSHLLRIAAWGEIARVDLK